MQTKKWYCDSYKQENEKNIKNRRASWDQETNKTKSKNQKLKWETEILF